MRNTHSQREAGDIWREHMSTKLITRDEAINLIVRRSSGTFMGITFMKVDGSIRTMCAKAMHLGSLKGTGKAQPEHVLPLWSVNDNGWRSLRKDSLLSFTLKGVRYFVV